MPNANYAFATLEECCHEALRDMVESYLAAEGTDFGPVQTAALTAAMRRGVSHADAERFIKDGWPKVVKRFRERLGRLGVL